MNLSLPRLLCLAAGMLVMAGSSASVQAQPSLESSAARANAGTVGIISGGVDGTYVRIATDLAAVLDDGNTLRVLPVIGKGSLQNLSDILYLHGIDIGIVQSDVVSYVRQRHLLPAVQQSVQYISKLYDEEVHVLARSDIKQIQDLGGQQVNVDVEGSGTAMTASLLFDALGIPVRTTNFDQPAALEKLKHGDLAAIVYVTGQPGRLFTSVTKDSGLHFVAVPMNETLLATYLPSELTHDSYPNLIDGDAPVPTAAVGSVMAVFAWQPGSDRYAKVSRFVDAFIAKFPLLLQPPRHPKWKDVNLAARVPGWTRFAPAEAALTRQVVAGKDTGLLRPQFDTFLQRAGVNGALTDAQKTALFRQFLDWDARTKPAR